MMPQDLDFFDQDTSGQICEMVTIGNLRGLHARAAAKFVNLANLYEADIQVAKGDVQVSGRSIMGLMMLAAARGTALKLCISGEDASEAMAALVDLVKRKFDEE